MMIFSGVKSLTLVSKDEVEDRSQKEETSRGNLIEKRRNFSRDLQRNMSHEVHCFTDDQNRAQM